MLVASSELNDFRLIGLNGRRFTPADSLKLHEIATRFIAEELDNPFEGPTVVVTHHSPSPLTEDQPDRFVAASGCERPFAQRELR